MPDLGLALLVLAGLGIIGTGLPAAIILIAAASFGALVAYLAGGAPVELFTALPNRLVSLLEHDLLQALPLYVLMGVLLNRLPLAEALYRSGIALLPRSPAAPAVTGLALGALLGPMNGSVGASVLTLSRVVAPRLASSGIDVARRGAIIAVASTLGVVVPPSLVLILLGDAMLSAHTIAVNVSGRDDRVLNTQDVFHGALIPAAILFVSYIAVVWLTGRRNDGVMSSRPERIEMRDGILAGFGITAIVGLLTGVATGYFYAVEAAAMGAFALLAAGLASGRLSLSVLRSSLRETMALTGSLFFLLVAATTLTLVLRVLGTDALVARWVAAIPGDQILVVGIVLISIAAAALVLDAFEIIFVVVPIVLPPLLIRIADAQWVSVMVLLTLQTSFLMPPVGYALMMVRGTLTDALNFHTLVRALVPFLLVQWLVVALVLLFPQLTHPGQDSATRSRKPAEISADELEKRFQDMMAPRLDLPETAPYRAQ